VDDIATAKRLGYDLKTVDLPTEFNGQAVARAEIAIEIGNRARLPLISTWICTVSPFQQWHGADENAIVVARNSSAADLGQPKTSTNIGQCLLRFTDEFIPQPVSQSVTHVKFRLCY
jgi:hypothetical protein